MKRLLIVTEAGNVSPSGWVRALLYAESFKRRGIDVRYVSRQPEGLARIVNRQWKFGRFMHHFNAAGAVLARVSARAAVMRDNLIVREAQEGYDVIYLQKVCSLSLLQRLRQVTRARIVFDLNDGLWLPANRGFFRDGNMEQILTSVDAVTSDNPYGVAHARKYCREVYLVPDSAQVEDFDRERDVVTKSSDEVVIGWIGSPGTLFNLFRIWEPLEKAFAQQQNLSLRIVGTGEDRQLLPRFEQVRFSTCARYNRSEMVRETLRMDIGLFPLFDVDDSRARGILKAEIYMSAGAAVVASPVGQICDVITHGRNGMLPRSANEWTDCLLELVRNPKLRTELASAGLATAREQFSTEAAFGHLCRALEGPRQE